MQTKGIDISEHQTRQGRIDFKKVKASGVDFCIVRLGWAGYEGQIDVDEALDQTINDAIAAGVNVGLYVYTYTRTPQAAKVAAREAVAMAKRFSITFPIVFDVEETTDNCLLSQGKEGLTDSVIAFLEEVERLGYYSMWYTYSAFIPQCLNYERLKKYDFWQADYRVTPADIARGIWQHVGDMGTCPGVVGPCDGNISYKDYPKIIREAGLNGFLKAPTMPDIAIDWESKYNALYSEVERLINDFRAALYE